MGDENAIEMKTLSDNQEKMLKSMDDIKELIGNLGKDSTSAKNDIQHLKAENTRLSMEIDRLNDLRLRDQQLQRSRWLEIRGIPPKKDENLVELMLDIADTLKVNISSVAIDNVFRAYSKKTIICKLIRSLDKENIMKQSKATPLTTKDLGFTNVPEQRIYINDSFTPEFAALFREAKDLQKDYDLSHVWYRDGFILLKRDTESGTVRICTWSELNDLRQILQGSTPAPTTPASQPQSQAMEMENNFASQGESNLPNQEGRSEVSMTEVDPHSTAPLMTWEQRANQFRREKEDKAATQRKKRRRSKSPA